MANYNIIGLDQNQYGPIAETQLRQWIAEGRVDAQTKVQAEGAADWKLLYDFPEFRDLARSSPPPPVPAAPKPSAMAVTSLVLGILGLLCVPSALVGLLLGIIAMVKVKNSGGKLTGYGIALAGTIVSGIFLILIPIVVLPAMLLPALAAAKQKAEEINCVNNEKQLALAIRIYSGDNKDHFPPAATWCDAIKAEAGSDKILKCPAVNSDSRCDYAFNAKLDGLDESKVNPQTVMLFEAAGGWNANGGSELMIGKPRHARMFVVAFADGSVQQLTESRLNTLRWDP
jgi:Domain of unknown function (DUF4190)/GYF domain 2